MNFKREGPKNIIIVGGGTAGWMAANWIRHAWKSHGTEVFLIESAEIETVGVGEGSTPFFRNFFRNLQIPESEWMPACNATYKSGISFPGWANHPDNKNYFHPFFTHLDIQSGEQFFFNACQRRRGKAAPAHPNDYFVTAALARAYRAPVPKQILSSEPDYAYHFDSGMLGQFLKRHALKLGVRHLCDTVLSAEQSSLGDITSLVLRDSGRMEAEFFIDCTGFSGHLIQKTLKEPFVSFSENLFNDRAVAISSSIDDETPLPVETESAALKHGWSWKIPLINRFGNGYVYSSAFVSPDDAEKELREKIGANADGQVARHLSMRVGRLNNHWSKNCLAVGLSQGFIEPLEATALMLVQFTIEMFTNLYSSADSIDQGRNELNKKINKMFDGVRDYIVAHYKLNTRTDTDYWIENRENPKISDQLETIFDAWDSGTDFEAALFKIRETQVYQRPSWYCLLAGMGRFPKSLEIPDNKLLIDVATKARQYCDHTAEKFFPDHRTYLQYVYGEKKA